MEIVASELSIAWLDGAQISYVDSVIADESDGGVVDPIGRQTRPLLQATISTLDVASVWTMFGTTRSGRKGFLIRPPLDRFKKVTAAALGTATGASQTFQLQVSLGTLSWDALYPVESTILLYANGLLISDSQWALTASPSGEVVLDAASSRVGQAITATFEYYTAVRFVDAELQETIDTIDRQEIQSFTVREVF